VTKGPFGRKDRLIKEKRHDTYREYGKWPEPTQCPECWAVFVNGRWVWQEPPAETNHILCPACRRIADRHPAGYLEIKGAFFAEHRHEVLNLVRNVEKQEKEARPLERIIAITAEENRTLVTTTGVHIARRIGEALGRAYKGELSFQYPDAEQSIQVSWQR
jgi:hypothetical protein